jgi:tetratricopeptide (TPR) repeat protein
MIGVPTRLLPRFFCTLLALISVGFDGVAVAAPPSGSPSAARPSTRPATQPAFDRERFMSLSQRAVDLIKQKRLRRAQVVLAQAIRMNPGHSINLYNMACVQALIGDHKRALEYLEYACLAGYTDFIHLERDPDLESLRSLAAYKAFLNRKDEFQRRAADRVIDWLKREFGEGYIYEVDAENKLIFATNIDRQTLDALRTRLVRQARSQWEQLFAHKPDQYISVVVPSPEDYRQIVSRPGVGGFYNHDHRILISRRLGQVMTHEFTHALHNADLDPLNQEHAIWVSEGLGGLWEAGEFDGETLVPTDTFRLGALQQAGRRGRLIPLQRLISMDQKAFVANGVVNLTYGQSGSLMLYLHERKWLKLFYDTYKQTYAQDKTGRLALEKATGMTLAELETHWKQWMMDRKPPVLNTGPEGAFLGIRFGEANDGLRVDGLVPNGAADAAGVEVGDVLVGLDNAEVRDQFSLMPLLGSRNPGERIVLKVRRGEAYLQIPVTLGRRQPATRS